MRCLLIVLLVTFTCALEEEYQYVVKTIDYFHKKYPKLVRRISIGKSVEKRDLTVLRISAATQEDLPALYLGASIHGNEYSHRPLIDAIHGLLRRRKEPAIASLLKTRIIWVQFMVNPDGVFYDTRQNASLVDLNRNFGFRWGTNWGVLSRSVRRKGNGNYIGTSAFCEPESRAVRDFLLQHKSITIYGDYHMSADMILTAFGAVNDPLSKEYQDLYLGLRKAMGNYGDRYNAKRNRIIEIVSRGSGYTIDWVYATFGVYSFTFEISYKRKDFTFVEDGVVYLLQQCGETQRKKPVFEEKFEK